MVVAGAGGDERDVPSVGRPSRHAVCAWVIRQPLRHTSRRRHDVDVLVAVVLPAERDLRSVRRKERVRLLANPARQAAGIATVTGDQPEVPGEAEYDLRLADGGMPEEQGAFALCEREYLESQEARDREGGYAHERP